METCVITIQRTLNNFHCIAHISFDSTINNMQLNILAFGLHKKMLNPRNPLLQKENGLMFQPKQNLSGS